MTEITELGLQPHLWIIPAVFAGLSALAVLFGIGAVLRAKGDGLGFTAGIVGVLAVLMGIVWAFIPFPYQAKYWSYYSVEGTVEQVSNGFLDGDGDITYRTFVVNMDGDDRPYLLTDPRITSLRGQEVTLLCTIEWAEYGWAADRWNCNIRSAPFVGE